MQSQQKTARPKKTKRPDNRPARIRYWNSSTLAKRKIGNLMKHCGMDLAQAKKYWYTNRQGRVKTGSPVASLVHAHGRRVITSEEDTKND